LNFIAFKSGGEVITNLLGGHIDVASANPGEALTQTRPIAAALVIFGLGSLALPGVRGVARWLRPPKVGSEASF
jgi:hypothetical protein